MDAATGIACVCVALVTLVRHPSPGTSCCGIAACFPRVCKPCSFAAAHRMLFSLTAACTHGILQWATFSQHASTYSQIISWCSNWEKRWKYRHIPGPAYSFPLGNLATVRKNMQFTAYTDWQAQYGDTFKMFFVRQPVVVTTGESVLNTAKTEHKWLGQSYD